MDYLYDVFISYSSIDQKFAEGICGFLETNGYRCFVAYRDIPRGTVWAGAIADAIDKSALMVTVFSKDFNLSDQTDREIELAAENKIPILTYRITDAQFSGAKKYYLKNLNWIDAFPEPETHFGKLLDSIVKLIGEKCRPPLQSKEKQNILLQSEISISEPAIVYFNHLEKQLTVFFDGFEYSCRIKNAKVSIEEIDNLWFEKEKISFASFVRRHQRDYSSSRIIVCLSPKAMSYVDVFQWTKKVFTTERYRFISYLEIASLGDKCLLQEEDQLVQLSFQNEEFWYVGGPYVESFSHFSFSDSLYNGLPVIKKSIVSDNDFLLMFLRGCLVYMCSFYKLLVEENIILLTTCFSTVSVGVITTNNIKSGIKSNANKIRNVVSLLVPDTTIPTLKTTVLYLENRYDLLIECDGQWSIITKDYIMNHLKDNYIDEIEVKIDIDSNYMIVLSIKNTQSEHVFSQHLGELPFEENPNNLV